MSEIQTEPQRLTWPDKLKTKPKEPAKLPVIQGEQPDCEKCVALCCRGTIGPILLYPEKFEYDAREIKQGHSYTLPDSPGQHFMARKHDGSCIHLGKVCKKCLKKYIGADTPACTKGEHDWWDHACTIYDIRPYVCRTFTCLRPETAHALAATGQFKLNDVVGTPPFDYLWRHPWYHAHFRRLINLMSLADYERSKAALTKVRQLNGK